MPNRPSLGRPNVARTTGPLGAESAPSNAAEPEAGSGVVRTHVDGLDSGSNSSSRIGGRVSNLNAAPGLLNGSVVLPNSGSDHPAVATLQGALQTLARRSGDERLNVSRSGRWDEATAEAVRSFQKDKGLVADGIVGPRTAAALQKALRGGAMPNILVGSVDVPTAAPKANPGDVAKAAQMLVDNHADNYGVPQAWYNLDPNHALPANVRLGGLKGAWKCNLFGGNALYAAGFEPPYYGNRGRGEYPNANQFYKWSDKYASKYGNKEHFKMVGELAIEDLAPEERQAKIKAVLETIQPGDLIMVDHRGDDIADGGHTRVATTAWDPETNSFDAAQASSDKARVKSTGIGNFTGEETLWVLRPNRPIED